MNLTLEVTTGSNWQRSVQIVRTAEMIWYDVLVQFSFPSLVTDPGKQGIISKLIHSSSYAVSKHPDTLRAWSFDSGWLLRDHLRTIGGQEQVDDRE